MGYSLGQGQPIIVLKEGTERTRKKEAQSNNIAAARAIADAVRTTLGPKGMDKMLVDSLGRRSNHQRWCYYSQRDRCTAPRC